VLRGLFSALLVGCASSPTPAPPGDPASAFAALAHDYWEWQLRENPENATTLGDHRFDDRLSDLSAAARARRQEEVRGMQRRLQAIDRAKLGGEDRVSWDVMRIELLQALGYQEHGFHLWAVDQMGGPQVSFGELAQNFHPRKTETDRANLRKRYAAFGGYIDQYVANLREGLSRGTVATRMATERVIGQLEKHVAARCDVFAIAEAGVVEQARTDVCPAYAKLLDFLRSEYLPRARSEVGIWALPGGADAYRFLIGVHTGTSHSAEEIHQIGLRELASIESEMEAIARKLGHKGTLREFSDGLRADKTQYFSDPAALLDGFRAICRRADAALPRAFSRLPRTGYEVKAIEAFRARDAVAAFYYPAPDDRSRLAVFYVNTDRLEARPRYNMEALAFHESVPGHHLQVSLAQEQQSLPDFRRHGGFTAFVEGWALYSERLADELGLYSDDRARFGMLGYQAWRAARLVVDTGIHRLRWTRQQAIDFLSAHTALSPAEVENEIDRYIIWPGQALAYKIGELEIRSMRRDAEQALGPRFDLRAFHDELLSSGAIPMPAARAKIDALVARSR
jgi:uncharacterized protein (DUF885 family)